jgi:hypothetical protein
MRCFYHPGVEAVGACKHCMRGLCPDCAAERDGGLACRGRCERDVDAISGLIRRNVQIASGPPWPMALRVLIYWGISVAMIYFGITQEEPALRLTGFALAALTFAAGLGSARWLIKPGRKPT